MGYGGVLNRLPTVRERERAVAKRDASYDGIFFTGVRTTGIFCRPPEWVAPLLAEVERNPSERITDKDLRGLPRRGELHHQAIGPDALNLLP